MARFPNGGRAFFINSRTKASGCFLFDFKNLNEMNKEANQDKKETGTLLVMLNLLDRYGVTDSMLERKYGLNRKSLYTVRKGGMLRNAHSHYFRTLLGELNWQRDICRRKMDDNGHRLIKETMFAVMLWEYGIKA